MAGERKFVTENIRRVLVKEFFMKETQRAGFGGLDIQRTPMGTRVTLMTERPGLVIGRRGATIKMLTEAVENRFKFDKPQIEVVEVENPNLNAQIMAEKLASALERGWHFRRAGHSTVRRIMGSGARGCQIIISGKLTGQRHRMEKFKEGHIKFCGEPKLQWMEEGFAIAKLKAGVIGVKVQIMNPNARLPDEVDIIYKGEPDAEAAPEPVVEEAPFEEKPEKADESVEEKPQKAPKEKKKDKKKQEEKKVKKEEKKEPEPKEEKKTEAPAKEPKPVTEKVEEKAEEEPPKVPSPKEQDLEKEEKTEEPAEEKSAEPAEEKKEE